MTSSTAMRRVRPATFVVVAFVLAIAVERLATLFVQPATPALRSATRGAAAAPATSLRAKEDWKDDMKLEKREAPAKDLGFPKFMAGGLLLFGLIGFIGGGPQLGLVFAISGAGFGALFEPV
mmetsp:Transcript_62954/g.162074  ORF Transcript_62954/g.162074 Transcript_62954/m.162074 type:complete len:122 (-) Transcript_62954:30-395(-)